MSVGALSSCGDESTSTPSAAATSPSSTGAPGGRVDTSGPPSSGASASTAPVSSTTDTTDATDTTNPAGTTATTGATDTTTTTTTPEDLRWLVNFAEPGSVAAWTNVDDTVMGGVSASTTTWSEGRMVFEGDLSLENNGGFTSVRGPIDPELGALLDGATDIVVDAEGDGRTYVFQLRTGDDAQYVARFTTSTDGSQQYRLPLEAFEPVTRFLDPAPDAPALDAGAVVQLTIYLLDGQEGRFRLAVAVISAAG
jgi:hypothetical protein